MKNLVLMSRDWIKVAASKTVGRLGDVMDDLFSGGTPFTPTPLSVSWSIGATMEAEGLHKQQDFAYRQAMGAQQAAYMGGLGGQLLGQLMGQRYPETKPIALQEDKVDVQVKLTRIDKEHILVEVECIQRIVHNAKELRELTAKLIEEHAEEFLFGEHVKKNPRAEGTRDLSGSTSSTREPPGAKEVMKK